MDMIDRHKVFISYYHRDDQKYKDYLINKTFVDDDWEEKSIFDDYSVGDGDIDDTYMTDEQIRVKIRDEYIKDATVLILLVGPNTKKRKHVDWEIHGAMFDTEKNPKMGILVINLPEINQWVRACSPEEKKVVSPNASWYSLSTRKEYEERYPYMPDRIIDNFLNGAEITVVDWYTIENDCFKLMKLIDNAFKRKDSIKYDHSKPLKRRNS